MLYGIIGKFITTNQDGLLTEDNIALLTEDNTQLLVEPPPTPEPTPD